MQLPEKAKKLLDGPTFVTVATLNADGGPHTSIVWVTRDYDEILLSTVAGRAKERNWRRDPRASVLIPDTADPYHYVEVRGTVSMTTEGGPELIQTLSQKYTGGPYTNDEGTDHVRVVVRVSPEHVVEH